MNFSSLWKHLKPYASDVRDIVLAFVLAFLFYKFLGLILGTPYPVLSVVSCSMVPTLHRGDVIIIKHVDWEDIVATGKWKDPNATIIVYYQPNQHKLIVHRVYKKFDENKTLITWGDNNSYPDPWAVSYDQVQGKVIAHIPYIGYIRLLPSILLGENNTQGC